jgi:hypothetical protein
VALIVDQDPIGALGPDAAREPLGERVARGTRGGVLTTSMPSVANTASKDPVFSGIGGRGWRARFDGAQALALAGVVVAACVAAVARAWMRGVSMTNTWWRRPTTVSNRLSCALGAPVGGQRSGPGHIARETSVGHDLGDHRPALDVMSGWQSRPLSPASTTHRGNSCGVPT